MKFKELLESADSHSVEGYDNDHNLVAVNKTQHPWGKMIVVRRGAAETFPLHPEHQEQIRNLGDGDSKTFKIETNDHIEASRHGDKIHLRNARNHSGISVKRSHFTE